MLVTSTMQNHGDANRHVLPFVFLSLAEEA